VPALIFSFTIPSVHSHSSFTDRKTKPSSTGFFFRALQLSSVVFPPLLVAHIQSLTSPLYVGNASC